LILEILQAFFCAFWKKNSIVLKSQLENLILKPKNRSFTKKSIVNMQKLVSKTKKSRFKHQKTRFTGRWALAAARSYAQKKACIIVLVSPLNANYIFPASPRPETTFLIIRSQEPSKTQIWYWINFSFVCVYFDIFTHGEPLQGRKMRHSQTHSFFFQKLFFPSHFPAEKYFVCSRKTKQWATSHCHIEFWKKQTPPNSAAILASGNSLVWM